MAYQVLARKWRPQDFESVVGQGPIVTALRNALTEGRIAQAYLFSGIRGVGKTSAARVLAKALNCERGPAADPCNECTACLEITAGSDLDVIEVDAATYSKVEQVRELTEGLKYGPARDRYKVVVIDEIHRLSRQAFDALLKIVEEPPPHLVFIFATTEIDAVPATVLSRCQEFHFRRVSSEILAAHLRGIAESEQIEASDAALRLIARAGEGSVRDSVALLDQLATFGSGAIADQDAVRLLGGLDTALFERLLAAVLAGDRTEIAAVVGEIEAEGWDPRHVYAQFLGYCRDAIHLAMGTDPDRVDLPREEADRLAERSRAAGFDNLLRLLQQLLASEETVRRSDSALLAVEIAWLRSAELPRLTRVEALLAGRTAPAEAPRTAPPVPPAARRRPGEDAGRTPARERREAPSRASRASRSNRPTGRRRPSPRPRRRPGPPPRAPSRPSWSGSATPSRRSRATSATRAPCAGWTERSRSRSRPATSCSGTGSARPPTGRSSTARWPTSGDPVRGGPRSAPGPAPRPPRTPSRTTKPPRHRTTRRSRPCSRSSRTPSSGSSPSPPRTRGRRRRR